MKRAALLLAGVSLLGCKAAELGWQFEIEATIEPATRGVVASVRDDGCDGSDRPLATYRFRRDDGATFATPTLVAGTYYLEVVALDAECRPIGRGCEPVTLPDDEAIVVGVDALAEPAGEACERGAICADGLCASGDAGL